MRQLLFYVLTLIPLCAYRCTPGVSSSTPTLIVSTDDPRLSQQNGHLLYIGVPFSGTVTSRYPTGQLQSSIAYVNGKQDGISQQWFADGRLSEIRLYADDRKTGQHEGWWPNGKRRFVYTFEKDIPVGHHQNWYPTGIPFSSFQYNATGHEEGRQQMWYETGQIKANYDVRNGRRFGLLGAKGCSGQ